MLAGGMSILPVGFKNGHMYCIFSLTYLVIYLPNYLITYLPTYLLPYLPTYLLSYPLT